MYLHAHPLLLLLSVMIATCRAEKGPTMMLNPLQRALMELRDAYATGNKENLCDANQAISAECHVCEALKSPVGGMACCVSVDAFAKCHIRVLELFDEIQELETNVIQPMEDNGEIETESEGEGEVANEEVPDNKSYADMYYDDERDKRYGNLFGHSLGKRYGNLYGKTFGKRYGNLYGKTFGKRYGNLYGYTIGKRYGNLFGNLFSKFNKNRNRH